MRSSALLLVHAFLGWCGAFIVPLSASNPATSLKGMLLPRVTDNELLDLGRELATTPPGSRTQPIKNASLRLAASEHAALTKSRDNFGVIREMESHMDAESPSCEARCSR